MTTTIQMTPAAIRAIPGEGGIQLLSARGIATEHELYINERATQLLYLVFPDGGPVGMLQRWARTPQDVTVWELPEWDSTPECKIATMRMQAEACQHVLNAALDEVGAEYDLTPEQWRP